MQQQSLRNQPETPKENPRATAIANRGASQKHYQLYTPTELFMQARIAKKHMVSLPRARVIVANILNNRVLK